MKSKVAAVVILYHPSDVVYENIESYREQVDILFVYDNSESKNFSLVEKLRYKQNITYIDNLTNKGVAEVLNKAAEKAFDLGYDFLLTMDQDSNAPKDLVKILFEKAIESEKIGIVSPLHSNKYNTHLISVRTDEKKVMTVMTSGNLLSLKVFKKIGGFCNYFFIDYVDIEYCIRMNFYGYDVIKINNVVLKHDEGNLTRRKFLSKIYFPINNHPQRIYYKTRNLLYLRKIYKKKYPYPLRTEYSVYFRNIGKMILFENQKLLKMSMIFLGILDYIRGQKGRKY